MPPVKKPFLAALAKSTQAVRAELSRSRTHNEELLLRLRAQNLISADTRWILLSRFSRRNQVMMVGQADWLTKKERREQAVGAAAEEERRVPTLSDAQWMAEQPQYAPEEAYMEEEWGVMMMRRRRRFRMMGYPGWWMWRGMKGGAGGHGGSGGGDRRHGFGRKGDRCGGI